MIGDGCTDDSEQVVASFADPRLHWENLPENTGNQSLPNNRGIERARGAWIAYLGHDDLWHPRHLERLIAGSRDCDVAFSLAEILLPGGQRRISGLFQDGAAYGEEDFVPPSSLLHRREVFDEVGPWRDYRTISLPPDFEWQQRARAAGKRFRAVESLTVFKLPSALRKDSYLHRVADEQAEIWRRLNCEPDFAERELVAMLRQGVDRLGPAPPESLTGAAPAGGR